ncbi:proline-specific peptidase [Dentipellis sp. KUC8613]|nr:proline-specific peptidase [Dentipellis sp. KUC8613]
MSDAKITEGKIAFPYNGETFETYYKLVGDITPTSLPPLIVVHGAPGTSHDYLVPIADLAAGPSPRPVLFYDQIGSSRSTHLPDKPDEFWSFELFIAELQNIVRHFQVEDAYHLLGHSWGGMIVAELVVRHHPKGLKSIVLANTLADAASYNAKIKELEWALPGGVGDTIKKHEQEGTTNDPEYKQAVMVFYQTHACRVKPFPKEILFTLSQQAGDGERIWAALEKSIFNDIWDFRDQIHLIDAPGLLINGEYDYMADNVCGPFFWKMNRIKWVKFAESSHMPHWEERVRYMDVLRTFLSLWDRSVV